MVSVAGWSSIPERVEWICSTWSWKLNLRRTPINRVLRTEIMLGIKAIFGAALCIPRLLSRLILSLVWYWVKLMKEARIDSNKEKRIAKLEKSFSASNIDYRRKYLSVWCHAPCSLYTYGGFTYIQLSFQQPAGLNFTLHNMTQCTSCGE